MITQSTELTQNIRDRFAHVDSCPFQGPRTFFENAGGALTLKSVVETSATFAAIPDNQGRANPASAALVDTIAKAKADMALFFNAPEGQFFVGESGTELLFRLIRTAVMGSAKSRSVIGSTVEHPASRSAAQHWAGMADSREEMEQQCRRLLAMGAKAVLLKGGHSKGADAEDCLLSGDGEAVWYSAPFIDTKNTHGTGCSLSSAIASHLALGQDLPEAIRRAKALLSQAIAHADSLPHYKVGMWQRLRVPGSACRSGQSGCGARYKSMLG